MSDQSTGISATSGETPWQQFHDSTDWIAYSSYQYSTGNAKSKHYFDFTRKENYENVINSFSISPWKGGKNETIFNSESKTIIGAQKKVRLGIPGTLMGLGSEGNYTIGKIADWIWGNKFKNVLNGKEMISYRKSNTLSNLKQLLGAMFMKSEIFMKYKYADNAINAATIIERDHEKITTYTPLYKVRAESIIFDNDYSGATNSTGLIYMVKRIDESVDTDSTEVIKESKVISAKAIHMSASSELSIAVGTVGMRISSGKVQMGPMADLGVPIPISATVQENLAIMEAETERLSNETWYDVEGE